MLRKNYRWMDVKATKSQEGHYFVVNGDVIL